ncbi:uncharacterized protein LOC107361173 [Tetranychus urticae]|uniref:HAUS augmin-like complex subunit 6 N-terminal domain-containing protein n=1 Tax=Tetranychus urticae TaxID=32264 RepID=T1K7W7_TETUR|nr:uncharacterized protein LOC107361173 [Tetranychus urticae]
MSQLQELQNGIFESLEGLSFNEYVVNRKECKNFILKRELFGKPDHKAFEIIMIFLVRCLKNSQVLQQYRYCYPCLDKNQEAEFRKVTIEFLKSLEKIDGSLKFTPIYAVQPGGEAFCSYFLNLINYVMTKVLKEKYGTEIEADLNDFRLVNRAEEESGRLSDLTFIYEDLDQKMLSEQEYFELRKRSLEKEWDAVCFEFDKVVNYVRVQILGENSYAMKDNEIIANVRQSVSDLNDTVSQNFSELRHLIEHITPKLELYNCPADASMITSSNQILDLRQFSNDCDMNKYFSRGCFNLELVSKDVDKFVKNFDTTMRNWASLSECQNLSSHLNFLNQEIEKLIIKIRESMDNLNQEKESLLAAVNAKRHQLLKTAQVQERRNWFAAKIPLNFPKIKFAFGDVSRDNLIDYYSEADITASPVIDTTPPDNFYNRTMRNHAFDWSFHALDISRFSYVPPTAPERPLLSPLREESSIRSLSSHNSSYNIDTVLL